MKSCFAPARGGAYFPTLPYAPYFIPMVSGQSLGHICPPERRRATRQLPSFSDDGSTTLKPERNNAANMLSRTEMFSAPQSVTLGSMTQGNTGIQNKRIPRQAGGPLGSPNSMSRTATTWPRQLYFIPMDTSQSLGHCFYNVLRRGAGRQGNCQFIPDDGSTDQDPGIAIHAN